MGRFIKVVAALVLLVAHCVSAKSFLQQDRDVEDVVEDRQFGGGYFYLPPWLDRLRDIPSLLTKVRVNIHTL